MKTNKEIQIEELLNIMEAEKRPSYIQFRICSNLLAEYDGSNESFRNYMRRYFVLERK